MFLIGLGAGAAITVAAGWFCLRAFSRAIRRDIDRILS